MSTKTYPCNIFNRQCSDSVRVDNVIRIRMRMTSSAHAHGRCCPHAHVRKSSKLVNSKTYWMTALHKTVGRFPCYGFLYRVRLSAA